MLPRPHIILVERDISTSFSLCNLLQALYPTATVSCVIDLAVAEALHELKGAECIIIHYGAIGIDGLARIADLHAACRSVPIVMIAVPLADADLVQMAGATHVLTLRDHDVGLQRALAAILS